jgi:hypothetical protein
MVTGTAEHSDSGPHSEKTNSKNLEENLATCPFSGVFSLLLVYGSAFCERQNQKHQDNPVQAYVN